MRRTISISAAAAVALAGTLTVGAPATAATPSLRFHGAQYDAPGKDTGSDNSLNTEWISLINSGSRSVNLNGYTVRDTAGHVHTFRNTTIVANGGRIWLRTGTGIAAGRNVFWGSSTHIWNNTGDKATLRNASGATLDTCSWKAKANRTWVAC